MSLKVRKGGKVVVALCDGVEARTRISFTEKLDIVVNFSGGCRYAW